MADRPGPGVRNGFLRRRGDVVQLAVRAPDVFAAVAPVSGGFFPGPRVPEPEATVPAGTPSVIACAGGSAVEVYTVAEMGHSWPGGAGGARFGEHDSGLQATQVIWAFFATRSRPEAAEISAGQGVP